MSTERILLSCPGRVQDWLGAAAEQIETLLQVPLPSLSGSDEAIGALRIKRERPSRTTGPYSLRPKNPVSGAFSLANQVPPSVSSNLPLCEEKSPSRCENCVAEERSRCSRDLPSCTRCHRNGMFCFYLEGVPTGRRKPQGRTRLRSRRKGEPGLSMECSSDVPVSDDPALLETGEVLAAQCRRPGIHPLHAVSEPVQSSLEKYSTTSIGFPTDTSCVGSSTNSRYRTKLETVTVGMDSGWPGGVVGLNPSSMRET